MKRAWLEPFTWPIIVETNRRLCLPKGAMHQASSDGYEPARHLWESLRCAQITLGEATDLCRRCHKLAPFCNFNGNTFVAVIRQVISKLPLPAEQVAALRSLAGHTVAGTATPKEQIAFKELLDQIGSSLGGDSPQQT